MNQTTFDHNPQPASPAPAGPADSSPQPAPPPLFSTRHKLGYILLVLVLVGLLTAAGLSFRRWIDRYQADRPRYAAERALKALAEGNTDAAKLEVDTLLKEVPIYQGGFFNNRLIFEVWEGPVLRNRVRILERLAAALMNADMLEQAEAVAWKAQLEYHIASRPLELLDGWELLYHIKALRQNWVSTFEIAKILAAHGADRVRLPSQIEPQPYPVNPTLFKSLPAALPPMLERGLAQFAAAETPAEYKGAIDSLRQARTATQNPVIRLKLNETIHRAMIAAGQRTEARQFLGQVWGHDPAFMDSFWTDWGRRKSSINLLDRDPTLLSMMWRDRPETATLSIVNFLDSFYGDSRLRLVDFSDPKTRLKSKQIGYFNVKNTLSISGNRVIMGQGIAATVQVQVTQPVYRLYLAFEAQPALGIYPIVLVRVNDEPYTPLYMDSTTPGLAWLDFDQRLEPATYDLEFVYLNDAGFSYPRKEIAEDRNLTLYRMALVHVPPSDADTTASTAAPPAAQ